MKVHTYWSWELPPKLTGAAAVVDVNAASTNMATLLSRGVSRLFLVTDETVHEMKRQYPDALVIGESLKLPKNFFVSSNWPSEIAKVDVKGRTVLFMTANGTRVAQEAIAKGADPVFAVGFMNFRRAAAWVKERKIQSLSILAAGEISFEDRRVAEDRMCAELLQKLLKGEVFGYRTALMDVKEFMLEHYRGFSIPYNRHIVFQENPVIPLCKQLRPGVIEVTDTA